MPCLVVGIVVLLLGACAISGPVVPDPPGHASQPVVREAGSAEDVFMHRPWEIWRVSTGKARYHREAHIMIPDSFDVFQTNDISVYAADGSDVRADYVSVDFGKGSQSRETISVSVYRSKGNPDAEWESVKAKTSAKYRGATPAQPTTLPSSYPRDTNLFAIDVPSAADETGKDFVQVLLFHEGPWIVRIDLICGVSDLRTIQRKTRMFLDNLRAKE